METVVAYFLLTVALYYLGARALITQWIWSRYPRWLDKFMLCSACSGWWYGFGVAYLGWWRRWSFLGLPGRFWLTPIIVGLCSMVWTPILANLHLWSVQATGAVAESPEQLDDARPPE